MPLILLPVRLYFTLRVGETLGLSIGDHFGTTAEDTTQKAVVVVMPFGFATIVHGIQFNLTFST